MSDGFISPFEKASSRRVASLHLRSKTMKRPSIGKSTYAPETDQGRSPTLLGPTDSHPSISPHHLLQTLHSSHPLPRRTSPFPSLPSTTQTSGRPSTGSASVRTQVHRTGSAVSFRYRERCRLAGRHRKGEAAVAGRRFTQAWRLGEAREVRRTTSKERAHVAMSIMKAMIYSSVDTPPQERAQTPPLTFPFEQQPPRR